MIITTEAPYWCRITVYHGETWYDPIFQFEDSVGAPFSLVGRTLQLFMRPTFDYATALEILNSGAGGGILIEDAANGLAALTMSESDVASILPVGEWEQFLRLGFSDVTLGAVQKLIWRGPLIVRPGRTAA